MKRRRIFLILPFFILALGFYFVHYKVHGYDERIVINMTDLDTSQWPRPRVAVVFGASVYSNGDLSPMLKDRVDTAIQLYHAEKVDRILVSGDNRHPSYNEPIAMQKYLITHAVAPQHVIIDYGGRSTYETCLRAREVFGLDRVVLVSQSYHLPRSLYIANELGLDAVGVAGNIGQKQQMGLQGFRELAAEFKAFYNLNFISPDAVLGEKMPIK